MNVRCTPIDELPQSVSRSLYEYSPFTSPEFVAILGREYGWGGYVTVESDQKIIAALPAVTRGRGPLARFQALLDGLPAPIWVDENHESARHEASEAMLQCVAHARYLKAYLTDFDRSLNYGARYLTATPTTMVDLAAITADFPPDKTLRGEIAKATRDGVVVTSLDRQKHLSDFLSLVDSTEARHGRAPKYSRRFWSDFVELCERDPRFAVLCVSSRNQLAAAHVFICDRDTSHNWQIYFDKSTSSLKPNQAITAHAIEMFRSRGLKYLNLGATPPDALGVAQYKQKWGGREYAYQVFEFRSLLGRILP